MTGKLWLSIALLVSGAAGVGFLLGCVWGTLMRVRKVQDDAAEAAHDNRVDGTGLRPRALEDGLAEKLEKRTARG